MPFASFLTGLFARMTANGSANAFFREASRPQRQQCPGRRVAQLARMIYAALNRHAIDTHA